MTSKLMPAFIAGLILTSLSAVAAPVSASNCSTPPTTSPACSFVCDSDSGVSVAISSQSGGYVQAGAFCPGGEDAGCDGQGYCSDTGSPAPGGQGSGSCSGFAEDGDGVLTCSGGSSNSRIGVHTNLLHIAGGACQDAVFRLLGLKFVAVIFVDGSRHGDSYTWSPMEGCWPTATVCENAVNSKGLIGTACRMDLYQGTQFH